MKWVVKAYYGTGMQCALRVVTFDIRRWIIVAFSRRKLLAKPAVTESGLELEFGVPRAAGVTRSETNGKCRAARLNVSLALSKPAASSFC